MYPFEIERDTQTHTERERDLDLLFHLFMQCAVSGDLTCNLDIVGGCSNHLTTQPGLKVKIKRTCQHLSPLAVRLYEF